jgi:hypothetical protein
LERVTQYIENNDKCKDIQQLGNWIMTQLKNYKKKKEIMSNEEIYNKWTEFINDKKYISYFQSNEE